MTYQMQSVNSPLYDSTRDTKQKSKVAKTNQLINSWSYGWPLTSNNEYLQVLKSRIER